MTKNNITLIAIALVLIIGGILFYVAFKSEQSEIDPDTNSATQDISSNVTVKDGVQYVTILAKNGYSPKTTSAQADLPTKLIVKTNNSFDCSVSLVIRQLSYHKILPQNGEETIDIGTFKAGEKLQGLCSMGMYSFTVTFK